MAQLKQALELNPRDYWSLFLLGTLYENRGEHALAYGAFSACIHLWPEFAWGYYNRGGVLRQLRLNHEAFEDYTASLKRDPGLAEAYISRGYLYLDPNLPQPVLALADFDAAAGLGRDDVALHRGRGIALDALHRVADADAAFDEAIERDPNNVDTLLSYGFAVSGRLPDKAFAAFGKVLERNPRNPRALYGCAMLLQRKSRRSGIALAYFNSALQVDPTFVAARLARANVLAYRAECAQAREDVDWCVKAEPSGATFYAAACVYALMADKASEAEGGVFVDRAVFLVQEAFRRGYGKDKAATDADLIRLRRHPDFRLLLRQVTETGAIQRGG